MSPDSLPIRLRNARGAMDLAEAAKRSGILAERIREYEAGTRQPYRKTLKRLAAAYGVPLTELVGIASSTPVRTTERRRRRRAAATTTSETSGSTGTVQIPVEIGTGQEVRIVFELVIRVQTETVTKTESEAPQPTTETASTLRTSSTTPTPSTVESLVPRTQNPTPFGAGRAVSPLRSLPRKDDGRDPLAALRRAHAEYRQSK